MDEADVIIKEVKPCRITGNNKVKVCNQAITEKCDVITTLLPPVYHKYTRLESQRVRRSGQRTWRPERVMCVGVMLGTGCGSGTGGGVLSSRKAGLRRSMLMD